MMKFKNLSCASVCCFSGSFVASNHLISSKPDPNKLAGSGLQN